MQHRLAAGSNRRRLRPCHHATNKMLGADTTVVQVGTDISLAELLPLVGSARTWIGCHFWIFASQYIPTITRNYQLHVKLLIHGLALKWFLWVVWLKTQLTSICTASTLWFMPAWSKKTYQTLDKGQCQFAYQTAAIDAKTTVLWFN